MSRTPFKQPARKGPWASEGARREASNNQQLWAHDYGIRAGAEIISNNHRKIAHRLEERETGAGSAISGPAIIAQFQENVNMQNKQKFEKNLCKITLDSANLGRCASIRPDHYTTAATFCQDFFQKNYKKKCTKFKSKFCAFLLLIFLNFYTHCIEVYLIVFPNFYVDFIYPLRNDKSIVTNIFIIKVAFPFLFIFVLNP